MKTFIAPLTLVNCLVVARALPADEIEQIEAFTGNTFSFEGTAMSAFNAQGPKWALLVEETQEPLVVAGLMPTGPGTWRTWFLANQRAWDEYGKEVTKHTAETLKKLLENEEHVRIETVCLAKRRAAQEWYEKIGLRYESTMHGYGAKGETAVMYTTVKGARGY